MSSGFEVFADGDENRPRTRQGKKVQQAPKRSALGAITNRQSQRLQPSRAAKLDKGENVLGALPAKQGFAVAQDVGVHGQGRKLRERKLSQKAPLQDITAKDNQQSKRGRHVGSSPMIVDDSMTEEKTVKRSSRSVDREAYFRSECYSMDIYDYLRSLEMRLRPRPNYIQRQPDINRDMRSILVDWLVEVTTEYKLYEETFFLAVNYIDRFLSVMSVTRDKLQLVGTTAMFIASKFEEIYPPDINEFVYVTDNSYTVNRVLKMEQIMLKTLTFDLSTPTSRYLAQRLLTLTHADQPVSFLTFYLLELSLVDAALPSAGLHSGIPSSFMRYTSSVMASAAVCLARQLLGVSPWTPDLQELSRYTFTDFKDCFQDLRRLHSHAQGLAQQSVQNKYRSSKYMNVSGIRPCPADIEPME